MFKFKVETKIVLRLYLSYFIIAIQIFLVTTRLGRTCKINSSDRDHYPIIMPEHFHHSLITLASGRYLSAIYCFHGIQNKSFFICIMYTGDSSKQLHRSTHLVSPTNQVSVCISPLSSSYYIRFRISFRIGYRKFRSSSFVIRMVLSSYHVPLYKCWKILRVLSKIRERLSF